MKNLVAMIGLTVATSFAMGCSAGADASDPTTATDDELRSSACPAEIEVRLSKPRILSDRRLLEVYEEAQVGVAYASVAPFSLAPRGDNVDECARDFAG